MYDLSCFKDDPTVDPSSLRFSVDDTVKFKTEVGWNSGMVVRVCQQLDILSQRFNESQLPVLYITLSFEHISQDDYIKPHLIHHDTDDYIQALDLLEDESRWNPDSFSPFLIELQDHLEFLYTGNEKFDSSRRADFDRLVKSGKGDVSFVRNGYRSIDRPEEPIGGIPPQNLSSIAINVLQRRPFTCQKPDLIRTCRSIVPDTTIFSECEAQSKTSNEKMLLLGDALMFGFHGWKKDEERARFCYSAAAWGCQESEVASRCGLQMGLPEAMMQCAILYIEDMGWGKYTIPRQNIENCLQTEIGIRELSRLLMYVNGAQRKNYVTLLTIDLAGIAVEMNLAEDKRLQDHSDIQKCVNDLLRLEERRILEVSCRELMRRGILPLAAPADDTTIELFGKKAPNIIRNIPFDDTLQVHVEYRQISRAPFPFVAYAIIPRTKRILSAVRLPENLQTSPFSVKSFQYIWVRLAFAFHLGDGRGRRRVWPSKITVLDSPGNREFASFLRDMLDGNGKMPGTIVRLVTHPEPVGRGGRRGKGKRNKKTIREDLGSIIQNIEDKLLDIPNYLISEKPAAETSLAELQQVSNYQSVGELSELVKTEPDTGLSLLNDLIAQGEELVSSSEFVGATRCYSLAIEVLRLTPKASNTFKALFVKLLTERAKCYISLAGQRSNYNFKKKLLRNASKDYLALARKANLAGVQFDIHTAWLSVMARLEAIRRDRFEFIKCMLEDLLSSPNSAASARTNTRSPATSSGSSLSSNLPLQSSIRAETNIDRSTTNIYTNTDTNGGLLLEQGGVIYDNQLAKNFRDGCPICLREFNGELSHRYCAVLPCGEHAVCAECICTMKKTADKEKEDPCCPLCRYRFNGQIVQELALQIIEMDKELNIVVEKFPAGFNDSVAIARSLLWKKDFRVDEVVETLYGILDDRISGLFFRTEGDLSHEQKEVIYRRARMPIQRLLDGMKKLVEERRTTFMTSRLRDIDLALRKVRSDLLAAREKARDEIYEKLNSVGNMGAQNDICSDGKIQVDYHGLHIGEMHEKYEELVEAILPVVKRVTIITGRGLHSAEGNSKLKKALKKKIEKDEKTRWEHDPNNPGVLIVKWVADE